ncbi:hypothetical protein J6590_017704 [Homalodisca vitripennis]|nr:hypothetical protein J6590_017704 [Homalodisca vitripennis]
MQLWKSLDHGISRFGDLHSPARTPELSPCDFFLRCHLKFKGVSVCPLNGWPQPLFQGHEVYNGSSFPFAVTGLSCPSVEGTDKARISSYVWLTDVLLHTPIGTYDETLNKIKDLKKQKQSLKHDLMGLKRNVEDTDGQIEDLRMQKHQRQARVTIRSLVVRLLNRMTDGSYLLTTNSLM